MIKCSIITPFQNGSKFIERHLMSLISSIEQTTEELSIECILVDNNSIDLSQEKIIDCLKKFKLPSNLEIILESYSQKNSSYAARNYGVTKSSGEILLFTDIDCYYPSSFMTNFVLHLDKIKNTDFAWAGYVRLIIEDESNLYEKYDQAFGFNLKRYVKQKTGVTACAAFKRTVFLRNNGFDEFESGADRMFFNKLKKTEKNLNFYFTNELQIFHPCRNSKNEILKKIKRVSRGLVKYNKTQKLKTRTYFLAKNLFGIFIQVHQIVIIYKTLNKKNFQNWNSFIRFMILTFYFGGYARLYICRLILFKK